MLEDLLLECATFDASFCGEPINHWTTPSDFVGPANTAFTVTAVPPSF